MQSNATQRNASRPDCTCSLDWMHFALEWHRQKLQPAARPKSSRQSGQSPLVRTSSILGRKSQVATCSHSKPKGEEFSAQLGLSLAIILSGERFNNEKARRSWRCCELQPRSLSFSFPSRSRSRSLSRPQSRPRSRRGRPKGSLGTLAGKLESCPKLNMSVCVCVCAHFQIQENLPRGAVARISIDWPVLTSAVVLRNNGRALQRNSNICPSILCRRSSLALLAIRSAPSGARESQKASGAGRSTLLGAGSIFMVTASTRPAA